MLRSAFVCAQGAHSLMRGTIGNGRKHRSQ